jgi:hypothetical protein
MGPGMRTHQADPLETFVDEGLQRMAERRYYPSVFIRMRGQHGTAPAIERLVVSGEVQSGFRRLQRLDMLEWSMEAAVGRFPDRFTQTARECAAFRLANVDDKRLRGR